MLELLTRDGEMVLEASQDAMLFLLWRSLARVSWKNGARRLVMRSGVSVDDVTACLSGELPDSMPLGRALSFLEDLGLRQEVAEQGARVASVGLFGVYDSVPRGAVGVYKLKDISYRDARVFGARGLNPAERKKLIDQDRSSTDRAYESGWVDVAPVHTLRSDTVVFNAAPADQRLYPTKPEELDMPAGMLHLRAEVKPFITDSGAFERALSAGESRAEQVIKMSPSDIVKFATKSPGWFGAWLPELDPATGLPFCRG